MFLYQSNILTQYTTASFANVDVNRKENDFLAVSSIAGKPFTYIFVHLGHANHFHLQILWNQCRSNNSN